MTIEGQSRINTVLLSIVVSISGFIAVQVWTLNTSVSAASVTIQRHSVDIGRIEAQLLSVSAEVVRINLELEKWKAQHRNSP